MGSKLSLIMSRNKYLYRARSTFNSAAGGSKAQLRSVRLLRKRVELESKNASRWWNNKRGDALKQRLRARIFVAATVEGYWLFNGLDGRRWNDS